MSDPFSRDASLPVFQAIGLKKEYDDGKVAALRGVDFKIEGGEFVAITGPSGCGKSTLLSMLGSLDKPSAGSLTYRGQSIPDLADPPAFRAREIGFIFQAFHLLNTFNVLENVQVPMFEAGWTRAQREARAIELLRLVGLDHRLAHFPTTLSGGERQRVAIARSMANRPGVILADEPTGNLDSTNASETSPGVGHDPCPRYARPQCRQPGFPCYPHERRPGGIRPNQGILLTLHFP